MLPDNSPKCITFQPDIYEKILGLLPQDRTIRILDVGAGKGYFCRKLQELGYRVEACDFLKEHFQCTDIHFTIVDFNKDFPFEENQFDCVISVEVIEHIENHFQFMKEIVRVTKPNGLIIITTPNILSLPSRWHFFLYGFTDCSPYPLDPRREHYYTYHINPISLPELLFCYERFGADLIRLTTNRIRKSAWLPMFFLYPLLAVAIRCKFLRQKRAGLHALYRRYIRWVLHPANLMGRITIAVGQKRPQVPM
jgi:SAM-dependent methyltransferase